MITRREKSEVPPYRSESRPGIPAVEAANEVYDKLSNPGRRGAVSGQLSRLALENKWLQEQVLLDHETGLLNRKGLMAKYAQLQELTKQQPGLLLSFMLVDADNFKSINSQFKYSGGDKVIKAMGALFREFREGDAKGRWGGDEFIILALMPDNENTETAVSQLEERATNSIQHVATYLQPSQQINITCSTLLIQDGAQPVEEIVDFLMEENTRKKDAKKMRYQKNEND